MGSAQVSEYKIGPFTYHEAVKHIREYALALTNLSLNKRFTMDPAPRPVRGQKKRNDYDERESLRYHVILLDKRPYEPKPEGLTTLHIRTAESEGYKKRRGVTYYEAFGQRKTLGKWAEVAGVSRPTLKARVDAGMSVEEAITQIALKKVA